MATLSKAESKDMYSWWWDSHISPKNSKWLQENLTDMDSKVRKMIGLIEVDEDSFAKRAEMYYKKRPELMKLVEEFYRAYRALAERYDHATAVIRQAHRTMADAFPNQVPSIEADDEDDSDPHTPGVLTPLAVSPPDFFLSGKFTGKSDRAAGPLGSKRFNDMNDGRARKGLNFQNTEKKDVISESERLNRSETDIKALQEALAKLEAEKEAGLTQYQQSLQRLSNLEAEVSRAQDDSKGLHERASTADAEVQDLKESIAKLEGEREASLHQYHKCLERISSLENNIFFAQEEAERQDQRANEAEKKSQVLTQEVNQLKSEKDVTLAKYMEALEKIANLENKLFLAEDKALAISKRADDAEKEVEELKQAVARVYEEKEALVLKYEQCLEKIVTLEETITLANNEAERLKDERDQGAAKLKDAEEQCLTLEKSNVLMKIELDSLAQKLGLQNEEVSEKQKELGRLWTCVQEERLRFVEVEAAFQALQVLHSQTKQELRSVASELEKRVQLLKETEIQNQSLKDEVQKVIDENNGLNEDNLSSAVSIKNMQGEINNLREKKDKLEGELQLKLDQTNALQQEIYCLKGELHDMNKKHQTVIEQVQSVGLIPECFASSVGGLQDDNLNLKKRCQKSEAEILALSEKLSVMEKLNEKNSLLEKSLSELGAELEKARAKVRALEESCEFFSGEKSTVVAEKATLISQLEITTHDLEKLSERNTFLENSLFNTNAELEALRATSKNLEESCLLLSDEKSALVTEKQAIELKLKSAQIELEELGKRHTELEQNYAIMMEERESTLRLVEELKISLASEKQENSNLQLSPEQITKMENQIRLLEEVGKKSREELERELDKAVDAQFEIFTLQNSLHDMKERNFSLLHKCEKLMETSKLSEKLISELAYENIELQDEANFLSDQIKQMRMGIVQLLKALQVDMGCGYDEKDLDEDQLILHRILVKFDNIRNSLFSAWDENQKLIIEKSVLVTLLGQLKQEVADLKTLIITLQQEFRIGNDQLSSLQKDMQKLLQSNEELILSVREGNHKEDLLDAQVESLREKLLDMQCICKNLEEEKGIILQENRSLTKQVLYLEKEKYQVELENSHLVVEVVALDTLSQVFKYSVQERLAVVGQLANDIDKLCSNSDALEEKLQIMEGRLHEIEEEKMSLKVSLKACEHELEEAAEANNHLKYQLSQGDVKLSRAEALKDEKSRQILELSTMYDQQLKERETLQESMNNLEAEVCKMSEKHEEAQQRVEMLCLLLQKGKDEVDLWETVAGTFFSELQTATVREALFKEKFSELSREYERLGNENDQVKAQLSEYIPAFESLMNCVASLESLTLSSKHDSIDTYKDIGYGQKLKDRVALPDAFSGLRDLAVKIKAIENSVIEMKQISENKHCETSSELDAAAREIEALKSQQLSRSHRSGSTRSSRQYTLESMEVEESRKSLTRQQLQTPSIDSSRSNGGDVTMMKDIMLDQVSSDASLHRRNQKGYSDSEDQILELWETINQAESIDLRVGKMHQNKARPTTLNKNNQQQHQFEAVQEQRSLCPPSESLVRESGVGVDKLRNSKRFIEPLEAETKKKIIERLTSDVQKLTNLQITVQDLKHKVESIEHNSFIRANKGNVVEYVGVKEQLTEAEKSILKLLEANGKLVKNVESSPPPAASSPDVSSAVSTPDSSDVGTSSRRRGRVSEQVRRCSEKIGKLQLEVQKIQFHLLKLNGGSGSNQAGAGRGGGIWVGERNTKVLLKDFLYSGAPKTPRRKKKSRFCGCVQPSTSGGD